MNRKILIVFLLFVAMGLQAQVTLPGTQIEYLDSKIVGQRYQLQINLPQGYDESPEKFGEVYILDAQWDFPLVYALYGQQYYDGFLPPLILVGITWGGEGDNPNTLRVRDFTPTKENGNGRGGGGKAFLQFIQEELAPYIETNYKADPASRTLMGSSLGGVFTIYAALESNGFFHNYIPTSPAVDWDNSVLFKMETDLKKSGQQLSGRMYAVVGGVEAGAPMFSKFMEQLKSGSYPQFALEYKIIEGIGHSGCKAEGNARGLQFAFERPSIQLSPAVLQKLEGNYTDGNSTVKLKVDAEGLQFVNASGQSIRLQAESERKFYSVAGFFKLVITAEGFELGQYGGSRRFSRL